MNSNADQFPIGEGTSEIQQLVVARQLLEG
jgi:alkylation response protein AidB-like acyl-CoA dehydrogenase